LFLSGVSLVWKLYCVFVIVAFCQIVKGMHSDNNDYCLCKWLVLWNIHWL